jgi:hypothetical protein
MVPTVHRLAGLLQDTGASLYKLTYLGLIEQVNEGLTHQVIKPGKKGSIFLAKLPQGGAHQKLLARHNLRGP